MKALWITVSIVIIFLFVWLAKDSILSHYLFKDMGMKISASNIWVTPSSLKMTRFRIKNPSGFILKTAFSSKRVSAEYTYSDLKDNPGYIEQVTFNDAFLSIDCLNQGCSDNNWKNLSQNRSGHKKNYIINRVIFENLTVEVLSPNNGSSAKKIQTIPYLELTQVSSEEGFPIQTIIQKVFQSANLQRYSQEFSQPKPTPQGQGRRAGRRTYRRNTWYRDNH